MTASIRIRAVAAAMLMLALLPSPTTAAAIDLPQGDGWYRWQTTSAATGADACCYQWRSGAVERCRCNLADRDEGPSIDTSAAVGDERLISVYIKRERGTVRMIRALNADCPVATSTHIVDLGRIDAGDSIAWLQAQLSADSVIAEDIVNAVGLHGGEAGLRALIDVIENRRYGRQVREHALFWLARSDSDDAFDYLDRLLSRR